MKKVERISRKFFHKIHSKHLKIKSSKDRLRNLINEKNLSLPKNFLKNSNCLDAGCGSSFHGSINLINLGVKSVSAIDLDKSILKYEKNLKKNVLNENSNKLSVKIGSVLNLPYKNNSFDFVLCQGVLHHTVNPLKGIKECYRVLKKGGFLYIQMMGKGGLIHEFVMTYLRDYYFSNRKFRLFFDRLNKKKFDKLIKFIQKNIKFGEKSRNLVGKKFLSILIDLVDEDFILTLRDRIASPIYEKYTFEEIKEILKKCKFKNTRRIYTKVSYKNMRNIFTYFYRFPNDNLSKFLYGSGLLNVISKK
tara:strand:- start:509 stop:1423 length:915 start_codon:yes stop_codon:yes gene_type:complete